ncbi:MAG: hypothetical protein INQ03_21395 [Candidatus Heimdallarchaeota archaeon]|nr:hypothetical protein [Candidatus Heimdallarchaeota archaeon]
MKRIINLIVEYDKKCGYNNNWIYLNVDLIFSVLSILFALFIWFYNQTPLSSIMDISYLNALYFVTFTFITALILSIISLIFTYKWIIPLYNTNYPNSESNGSILYLLIYGLGPVPFFTAAGYIALLEKILTFYGILFLIGCIVLIKTVTKVDRPVKEKEPPQVSTR